MRIGITINELQEYIRIKDHKPEQKMNYFCKLIEEVGELAEALRKEKRIADTGTIKGTIEEELYDVLYYILAIANVHDIKLEDCAMMKEEINRKKWESE